MNRLAVTALLLASACAEHEREPEKVPGAVTALVATVVEGTFAETIDALGAVTTRAGHVAVLAAPAPTRIARVFVAAGTPVKRGDPLVEFEQAPFDAAAASADAALSAAERAAARTQRLADAGVLPRKEAEAAATELAVARSSAVTARRSRDLSTLRAPIAGVVTRISAVLGASTDPSQALVEIADPQALDVLLVLSPSDAARARAGQQVSLFAGDDTPGAPGAPEAPVARGRVADVASIVDSASGGVSVRVGIESATRMMRIAEALTGRIAVAQHTRAIVVPAEALVPSGDGFRVFVVDRAGIAHATAVIVGGRSPSGVWIVKGIGAGDRVVTRGAYGMDDSAKIVPGKP